MRNISKYEEKMVSAIEYKNLQFLKEAIFAQAKENIDLVFQEDLLERYIREMFNIKNVDIENLEYFGLMRDVQHNAILKYSY